MAIDGIRFNAALQGIKPANALNPGQEAGNFKDMLIDALENVSELQHESDAITEDFITGRTDSIHDVLIAGTQASLALDFVIEVRNKVMEAYQEIMRMQV